MNKSRRKFLGKAPAVALAAGVGVASGKIAMASPPPPPADGTRHLLEAFLDGQRQINGLLYEGDDLLLDVLRMIVPHVPGINLAAATAKLDQAAGYIDAVPGIDPPGCQPPGGGG
jgi:hypothetical protein